MQNHETVLAALLVALGIVGCMIGIVVFVAVFGGGLIAGEPEVIAITGTVATIVSGLVFVFSLPPLLGGIGLLRNRHWGRVLALVACAMHLLNVPFGTSVGIYGLWVLNRSMPAPAPAANQPAVSAAV